MESAIVSRSRVLPRSMSAYFW